MLQNCNARISRRGNRTTRGVMSTQQIRTKSQATSQTVHSQIQLSGSLNAGQKRWSTQSNTRVDATLHSRRITLVPDIFDLKTTAPNQKFATRVET